jgi:hypothetical protein
MALSSPAVAGPSEDAQAWTTISASGAISGCWLAQGESDSRFGNALPRLYQQELIAGIGYKLGASASLYGGYGIVMTSARTCRTGSSTAPTSS